MRIGGAGTGWLAGATAAALSGADAAATAFEVSARVVAASGAPPEIEAAPEPAAAAGAGLLDAQASGGDLASAIVDGTMARRAYEANLGVLRTADEMTGAALRILG